jgi:hypothetical protein
MHISALCIYPIIGIPIYNIYIPLSHCPYRVLISCEADGGVLCNIIIYVLYLLNIHNGIYAVLSRISRVISHRLER